MFSKRKKEVKKKVVETKTYAKEISKPVSTPTPIPNIVNEIPATVELSGCKVICDCGGEMKLIDDTPTEKDYQCKICGKNRAVM
jgi:hypothetical protein